MLTCEPSTVHHMFHYFRAFFGHRIVIKIETLLASLIGLDWLGLDSNRHFDLPDDANSESCFFFPRFRFMDMASGFKRLLGHFFFPVQMDLCHDYSHSHYLDHPTFADPNWNFGHLIGIIKNNNDLICAFLDINKCYQTLS